eukprot:CAMPEP_0180376458 /NCGR_PEP_ID=MMETSP0989-20121125/23429_1 /TAXON_ID=697907 /ORGANISM="non described non described, Strain CCMP2293" /LENGTH=46 /DNA_ID= /DNA_START= /DNA_END= /DNA_ORIENTATION=
MKCTMRTSRLQASIMVRWKSTNVVWGSMSNINFLPCPISFSFSASL